MNIEKAYYSNFEEIYPLLLKFDNPNLIKERWKRLFTKFWNNSEDFVGFKLYAENRIVGFMGLIFSERFINNKIHHFANMTSWFVEPDFRQHSIALLLETLKLKGYCFTNLTPHPKVFEILKKLNFGVLADKYRLVLPIPLISKINITYDTKMIFEMISEQEKKILSDHIHFDIKPVLINIGNEYCLMIITKVIKKKIPFVLVHYIGNKALLNSLIGKIAFRICRRFKATGILLHNNQWDKTINGISLSVTLPKPMMFKSDVLEDVDIDTLYSELVVLNL